MSTIVKSTTPLAAGGRMTVDEFERFTENLDEPFELIEGLMVAKVTKKPPHVIATENVRDELLGLFSRPKWRVSTESPVRIPDYNEPEPDVMLIRGSKKTYVGRTPGPADLRWSSRFHTIAWSRTASGSQLMGTLPFPSTGSST